MFDYRQCLGIYSERSKCNDCRIWTLLFPLTKFIAIEQGMFIPIAAVYLRYSNQIPMQWDKTSAVVITILHRSTPNTNLDTVVPKKYFAELNTISLHCSYILLYFFDVVQVLQEASPTSPLIVFFHFNNTVPNTNSNSTDSTFVQKLVDLLHGLISFITSPLAFIPLISSRY